MWQFLLGTTLGTQLGTESAQCALKRYLGTYYNFRPYLEALQQFYQRRIAEAQHEKVTDLERG